MLSVSNLSVQFGKRVLFDEVNVAFTQGNCYGVIGANGAGKSTFLKILAGQMDPTSGHVHLEPSKRMSILEQNHNAYDTNTVLEAVVMGNKPLFALKTQIDELYANYTDENAEKIGELQVQFEDEALISFNRDEVWAEGEEIPQVILNKTVRQCTNTLTNIRIPNTKEQNALKCGNHLSFLSRDE